MRNFSKVLLLGSGALKIGEAGEFDYSGTQAIKALKEEGIKVILVNPNVATVQTSEGFADEVYFLPVQPFFVEQIIRKEKPHGILLSFGGQTALNCGLALARSGVLKTHGVQILGTPIRAIEITEDRKLFAEHLKTIGLSPAKGKIVASPAEGMEFAETLGYPVMLRVGYALGGTGSGIASSKKELETLLTNAFATTSQVLIEESLWGWKEIEYEVVRDQDDNCITVCNMENFDPVGIHTGESIVVAPSQTLNNEEYYRLRQYSMDTIRSLKIVGECNIQFALNPDNGEVRVIEVNARLSRSSALASKATGYPLAYIAAKLALGKALPKLRNSVTQVTSAFFEPALDYIVVKIPRWDLDKFTHVTDTIGSEMKSVGEVMAIGRSFEEAIQKAVRALNQGRDGVMNGVPSKGENDFNTPSPKRLYEICESLYSGSDIDEINRKTGIDKWFLEKLANIVGIYRQLYQHRQPLSGDLLSLAKKTGFSDNQIARMAGKNELNIRNRRKELGIIPVTKSIDTLAGEFPARTNYLYLTYYGTKSDIKPDASFRKKKIKKAIIVGCGPYAIGTSVEFDWCAVSTSLGLREQEVESVIINCNPETVSTDYDMSDYLYFEELSWERVMDIYDVQKAPLILSVGGQISNNLALRMINTHIPVLGTQPAQIKQAESRDLFSKLLDRLQIPQPPWSRVQSLAELSYFSQTYGFPVLVRPSYVLSGQAMSVLETPELLKEYMKNLNLDIKEYPLVVSRFFTETKEVDFDGVAAAGHLVHQAVSEHVEYAGVHSGDATMALPSINLSPEILAILKDYSRRIVGELKVNGPFNIQYLVKEDNVYVIECNLRASRSFPFVSKVTGSDYIRTAVKIALGVKTEPVPDPDLKFQAIKAPQFSFHKLRGADPVMTVEMNSTGEVMGLGRDKHEAYLKATLATGMPYPSKKAVFISLGGSVGKLSFLQASRMLYEAGYKIFATAGTTLFLKESGIEVVHVGKIYEGTHPNIIDLLSQKSIDFAVVTPEFAHESKRGKLVKSKTDGYIMRRMAIDLGIPIFTNAQNARLFSEAIIKYKAADLAIRTWKEYINMKGE